MDLDGTIEVDLVGSILMICWISSKIMTFFLQLLSRAHSAARAAAPAEAAAAVAVAAAAVANFAVCTDHAV